MARKLDARISQAYIAENLVFQELQNEFRGSVVREVRLPSGRRVDGVVRTEKGDVLVEVKLARSAEHLPTAVRNALERLAADYQDALANGLRVRGAMAVLVTEGPVSQAAVAKSVSISHQFPSTSVRVFSFAELAAKYGLPVVGDTIGDQPPAN